MGITTALMAIGTGLNTFGALAGASADASSYRYQAQVARYNADVAAAEGESKSTAAGLKSAATVGAIRSAFGANNVDVNTGSAAAVQESSRRLGLLDALTIRSDAAREAYAKRTQARLYDKAADDAATMGWLKAASSLVSGATAISSYGSKKELVGGANTVADSKAYNPAGWVTWGPSYG